MRERLPHVDGSGRGLDDGDCIHCGSSGSLEREECPARLRARVDELERSMSVVQASLYRAISIASSNTRAGFPAKDVMQYVTAAHGVARKRGGAS